MHQGDPRPVGRGGRVSDAGAGAVVWITGATGGIGSRTALIFAARGARLALLARSPERLPRLREECLDAGAREVLVAVADVTDAASVERALQDVISRFGRLDVCIHSAAVVAYGRLEEVPHDVWRRTVDVGLVGTAIVARAALDRMYDQQHGSLLVVGSVLGQIAVPYMSAYVSAKWGVRALVRCLQQEARRVPGVHVGIVAPGAVDTAIYPLAASYLGRQGRPPPPVVSAERAAEVVVRAVDRRRRSAAVGPANTLMRLGFTVTPWLFDLLAGALLQRLGLGRTPMPTTSGNTFTRSEDVDAGK